MIGTAPLHIALLGEHDPAITAHRAIPLALEDAAERLGIRVRAEWIGTQGLEPRHLAGHHGLWCVPGSPYADTEGALRGIRHARVSGLPFLGTCGGFQHAVLEHARNVLGWVEAAHAETAPEAGLAVVSPLSCALVECIEAIHLTPGSRLARAYGSAMAFEGYHCRYGVNPDLQPALLNAGLSASAHGSDGALRAVERDDHPFFVATLFQPERAALAERPAPLVQAFLRSCAA
ncbi:CTP synthase C-terminal region-related (seleno)protein [Metapseudomonas otitidis]|uniref:CTP synthase C-terminal region-related (seleno)protein n=1 Tax=Metapseudomonas otitidis TaxID=319939 RepID=UPI003671124B